MFEGDIADAKLVSGIVAAGTCAELAEKDDVKEFYLGVGASAGTGQARRWKRRKTWR